jgi:creatinine amidohydrolase
MEVEWRRLRADELRQAAASPETVVILPTGSLEQHGPHLPVEVDSVLVEAVALASARAMAQRGGRALVLPVLWTGISEHHMSLGGTVSLDAASFIAVVGQVCRSVARHGFRRIALLNGHGGNEWALRVAADELTPALGLPVVALTYWNVAAAGIAEVLTAQARLLHACEAETSMMQALRPELVARAHIPPAQPLPNEGPGVHRWRRLEEVSPVGVIGTPAAASAEKGHRLLSVIAEAVATALLRPGLWAPFEPTA